MVIKATEHFKIKLASTVVILLKWSPEYNKYLLNKSSNQLINSGLSALSNQYDYKIMMIKRSSEVGFFPMAHVFPGGALDPHDEDEKWKDVIENASSINQLSLKISALREVFEETNFILDKNSKFINRDSKVDMAFLRGNLLNRETSRLNNFLLEYFQKELPKSNSKLSLNNLYQWARWITPKSKNRVHGFDTYFYVTPIYEYPEFCKVDGVENTQLDWFSPQEVLSEFNLGNVSLPPPTWFTILQLKNLHTLDQVIDAAKQREKEDILYDPIMYKKRAGSRTISQIFRGDSLYNSGLEGPLKNRININSKSGELSDQKSWCYKYLNNVTGSIDRYLNGSKSHLSGESELKAKL